MPYFLLVFSCEIERIRYYEVLPVKKTFSISRMFPVYTALFCCMLVLTFGGSRAVTVLSENAPVSERKCVIIDPGHGGVDGGATSCTGVLESNINLQISLRLNDLMHLLGIDTIMIRDSDRSIHTQGNTIAQKKISDLKQRVSIVNSQKDALLISIHQNHFTDSRYFGPQVFYGRGEGSAEFAKTMQSILTRNLCPDSNRQAKSAKGVYLMEKVECTALLIECGFISNPEEEARLLRSDYQRALCCVIAAASGEFLYGEHVT